jgi:hypothetical protein
MDTELSPPPAARVGRGRTVLALMLLVLGAALTGWAIHICSYDARRGVVIAAASVTAMLVNGARVVRPGWSLPRFLRNLAIGTALTCAVAVGLIAVYLHRADAVAHRLEDPALALRWQMEKRSLPALSGGMALLALTALAIPGRRRVPTPGHRSG